MYHYYQEEGGTEKWRVIRAEAIDTVKDAMFVTILGVDNPVPDEPSKEQLNDLKYKGPLYFDLDDAESPASTSIRLLELVNKLKADDVDPNQLYIYATGGKGFHLIVPEKCFLLKPPKSGFHFLPAIYKEMAFSLSVDSMDFRVYTARRGRMLRQADVKRPNGLYKVQITYEELEEIAEQARKTPALAEEQYKALCAKPRGNIALDEPTTGPGLMAKFDLAKNKVSKNSRARKAPPPKLPDELPSFDALLRGEGIKADTGFHQIAMQVAIIAHARGISKDDLLAQAQALCDNHHSDGRYNSAPKRLAELGRMWEYMEDNPCYLYSASAVGGLLTHNATDLYGIETTKEEVLKDIEESKNAVAVEFEHAGVLMNSKGVHVLTENGSKLVTAMSFDNVTELISAETGKVAALESDILIAGRKVGHNTFELEQFNSVSNINKLAMSYGQTFSGNDVQGRGIFMRMVQQARKSNRRMYVVNREGLDLVRIAHHDDPRARDGFMVWADTKGVVIDSRLHDLDLQFRFVGYPDPEGTFRTDLSVAPMLNRWLRDPEQGVQNKEELRETMWHLLSCQNPGTVGRMLGWVIACHYRMMFHKVYSKFPLLHINGAAGNGKTESFKLFSNFHYCNEEPKMLTPTSTLHAVKQSATGSSSIPLILDEFKPGEMKPEVYDQFKLILRDAYNCRMVERGGGTRDNIDFRSIQRTQLAAPMCFIAEAAESESALMERVVLITLVKPPVIQAQAYFQHFKAASDKRHLLGILGKYVSAQIVKQYGPEDLEEEFAPIYDDTRKELMLQEGEQLTLSPEEVLRKSGAKERTVFNYSVVKFGLMKIRNLMKGIYGEEFEARFEEMMSSITNSVGEIQSQTIPEWLKVFNCFSDMARVDPLATYFLKKGEDYAFVSYDGRPCLELYVRSCFFKYRTYCATSRSKPLFTNDASFTHALNSLSALMARNSAGVELACPGGSHIFDLTELRASGFVPPDIT